MKGTPCPTLIPLFIVLLMLCTASDVSAQGRDSIPPDSASLPLHRKILDSAKSLLLQHKPVLEFNYTKPFDRLFITRPLVKFTGGQVSYQFSYRANIDTPYVEKDIAQHNTTGNLNFLVGGFLPVRTTFWSRQSNSKVFRDITDVQVSFSGSEFKGQLQAAMKGRLLGMVPRLQDSLLEKMYALKKLDLESLKSQLQTLFSPQKLVEANEMLKVPRITWKTGLSDEQNQRIEDSLKKVTRAYLELYKKTTEAYQETVGKVDSLKKAVDKNQARLKRFRELVNGKWQDITSARQLRSKLDEYGLNDVKLPAAYQWLMGVRQFSLGRSTMNHSELTAKNISVNGINFEYNSWYYFAVSAGMIDYRFRDFVMNGANKRPQYLYLLRAGIGQLEKNYFILTGFRGQKQLFAASRLSSITIHGVSAEARWQVNNYTWVTGEVAKSIAPDYRNTPSQGNTKFKLSDHTNQAFSIRVNSFIPATGTRIDAFYKKTGANYQSFSSFQTNAAMESWHVKGEQHFFRRRLKVAASIRKNEFSNPFLQQNYQSNTVFKSVTASFRARKWPAVMVGYQPMSQLMKLDDQVVENRFQTLTASIFHNYRIRQLQTATTLLFNKFYNNNQDSGFIYYNATNVYWMQNFFFSKFTAGIAVSYTKNSSYTLNVLDENIQLNFTRLGSVGFGVKINSLNGDLIKVGGYANANIRIYRQDMLYLSYERGYLPGFHRGLTRNEMATVQFVKTF